MKLREHGDTTPTGVTVQAVHPDGTVTDVTSGVMALYDLVISSMDWGSGFLTVDDALPVVHIAKVCGFAEYEEAEEYVHDQKHSAEQRAFLHHRDIPYAREPVEHDHIFSSVGLCMWPGCDAEGEPSEVPPDPGPPPPLPWPAVAIAARPLAPGDVVTFHSGIKRTVGEDILETGTLLTVDKTGKLIAVSGSSPSDARR